MTGVVDPREHTESIFLESVMVGGGINKTESVTGPPQHPSSVFRLKKLYLVNPVVPNAVLPAVTDNDPEVVLYGKVVPTLPCAKLAPDIAVITKS